MYRGKVNFDEIVGILNEFRGTRTWRQLAKDCRLGHSVVVNIKNGKYVPGYTTLMKLACCAPLPERNRTYFRLMKAAGLGAAWLEEFAQNSPPIMET